MSWLATFFEKLFIWMPRIEILRATHGGVKWRASPFRPGLEIIELKPGLHFYWPLTTDFSYIVTARRTVDVPPMSILTQDGQSMLVSAAVVFRINSVVAALGERNWDVDLTLVDVTQSVIFRLIRQHTVESLLAESPDDLIDELTAQTKREINKFGVLVERVLLKDFDRSRTYRMVGAVTQMIEGEE